MLSLVAAALLALGGSRTAFAWGWGGHRLVCALAEKQLTPRAQDMVAELLEAGEALEGGKRSFVEACVWADRVKYSSRKDTYTHHFINVPKGAARVDLARDCADRGCIATGLQEALDELTKKPVSERDLAKRAAALRFLGHYVADAHQPLHVSYGSDKGGNLIKVRWRGEETNLHAVWDTQLPEAAGLTYPASLEYLPGLESISRQKAKAPMHRWLQESLDLARSRAYVHASGKLIQSGDLLLSASDNSYLNRNKPVVIDQLLLAASRLAHLLNQIAAGKRPADKQPGGFNF